jgi:hypothetical protein
MSILKFYLNFRILQDPKWNKNKIFLNLQETNQI